MSQREKQRLADTAGRPGSPLTKQRSPWEDVTAGRLTSELMPWPQSWHQRRVGDGTLFACVAEEPEIGLHLSISFRNHHGEYTRYPTWDEIAHARYELLPHDLDFVMHLPPPDQYLAVHDTTFHLHQHLGPS